MKDFFQIVQWWTRLCCFLVQLISKVPFLKNLANSRLCSVLRGCRIATSWSNLVQGPHKREKSKQKLFGSANLKSCFFEQILSNYPFCSVRGCRTATSWSNLVPGPHEREKSIEQKLFGSGWCKVAAYVIQQQLNQKGFLEVPSWLSQFSVIQSYFLTRRGSNTCSFLFILKCIHF